MAKKILDDMRITPAENGGITVRCCYKSKPTKDSKASSGLCMQCPPSEEYVFGKSEGDKAAAFILKMAGIPGAKEELGEEEHNKAESED